MPDAVPAVSASDLSERVLRVAHLIRRTSMAALAPLQLTPAQSRALRTISNADGPIRMGEIASLLGVAPRSATDLVEALQAAGLVERRVDRTNRRSVLVTLTERGREIQHEMALARAATANKLFGSLDPADRRQLADLLTRVGSVDVEPRPEPAGGDLR